MNWWLRHSLGHIASFYVATSASHFEFVKAHNLFLIITPTVSTTEHTQACTKNQKGLGSFLVINLNQNMIVSNTPFRYQMSVKSLNVRLLLGVFRRGAVKAFLTLTLFKGKRTRCWKNVIFCFLRN